MVLSGKGGVGKSTVAAQISLALWRRGLRVGLLDVDFCGPSVPLVLGLQKQKIHRCPEGWLPVYADPESKRLRVVSIGFLLDDPNSAVIWRGPRKAGMVGELLHKVCWGKLDYLIIDTPPGTSDEHLSVLEQVRDSTNKFIGAVVVSTPQRVSLCDVRRELGFCRKTDLNVIGLIENMSGYQCPNCSHCTNIFSSGGCEFLAKENNIHFLGRVPLNTALTKLCDSDGDFESKSKTTDHMTSIVNELISLCAPNPS